MDWIQQVCRLLTARPCHSCGAEAYSEDSTPLGPKNPLSDAMFSAVGSRFEVEMTSRKRKRAREIVRECVKWNSVSRMRW